MKYVMAIVGGLFVFFGVFLFVGFVATRVTEGMSKWNQAAAVLAAWFIAFLCAVSSYRATIHRSKRGGK